MSNIPLVETPASFVPQVAIAFGSVGGAASVVDAACPLPTRNVGVAADSVPLAGTSAATGTFGPFAPDLSRAIWVTLSGSWSGSVQLLRSTDGGTTNRAITTSDGTPKGQWSGNVNAPITEETVAGAHYYLAVTLTSGTLAYEVRQ